MERYSRIQLKSTLQMEGGIESLLGLSSILQKSKDFVAIQTAGDRSMTMKSYNES